MYYIQRCDEYEGVESESRASRIKIYDTFGRAVLTVIASDVDIFHFYT